MPPLDFPPTVVIDSARIGVVREQVVRNTTGIEELRLKIEALEELVFCLGEDNNDLFIRAEAQESKTLRLERQGNRQSESIGVLRRFFGSWKIQVTRLRCIVKRVENLLGSDDQKAPLLSEDN